MTEFFKTGMGAVFYNGHVPRIVAALERIGTELQRQNDTQMTAREAGERKIAEVQKKAARALGASALAVPLKEVRIGTAVYEGLICKAVLADDPEMGEFVCNTVFYIPRDMPDEDEARCPNCGKPVQRREGS